MRGKLWPPFSILDLSPVAQGSDAGTALARSLELAQRAEQWGYKRYWLAEHHNMPGIASAATAVALGYVAGGTKTIRIGSGGIMLPNHSPLVIAEQFGTLASLYPGRVDLGLGRAPGTDPATAHALRRGLSDTSDHFAEDVVELQAYFRPVEPGQRVQAVPGAGLEVPLWILGSSLFGAQLAAALGLPFAFASHFAPHHLEEAIELYRDRFEPSRELAQPHLMVAVAACLADTDEEARRLFTSQQQSFVALRRGQPGQLPPPVDRMDGIWNEPEREMAEHAFREAVIGAPRTARIRLDALVRRTRPDELIFSGSIYDQTARLRAFELLATLAN